MQKHILCDLHIKETRIILSANPYKEPYPSAHGYVIIFGILLHSFYPHDKQHWLDEFGEGLSVYLTIFCFFLVMGSSDVSGVQYEEVLRKSN